MAARLGDLLGREAQLDRRIPAIPLRWQPGRLGDDEREVLLGLIPLVPLPVRDLGREDHQVARWHLVAVEPDLDAEDALEHVVELVEFVYVQRRSVLPGRD